MWDSVPCLNDSVAEEVSSDLPRLRFSTLMLRGSSFIVFSGFCHPNHVSFFKPPMPLHNFVNHMYFRLVPSFFLCLEPWFCQLFTLDCFGGLKPYLLFVVPIPIHAGQTPSMETRPAMMSLLWRPENIFTVRFCIFSDVCRSVSVHGDQACDDVSNSWLQNLKG